MRLMTLYSAILTSIFVIAPIASVAETLPKPVKLMITKAGDTRLERQFFGHVTAKKTVNLAFQVSGQVLKFPVTEGFIAPKGTLIAQLDLEPFELQLQQAQLQKTQADRTLARFEGLTTSVSRVSIDDAKTQAGLADIALRNAEFALRHATLEAPFDALISSREVPLFTTVGAGTPIVRLHDMSELHIEVDVPEILFQKSGKNAEIEVSAAFPGREGTFPMSILEFAAEASNIGQTYRVTFLFQPPKGMQIYPGASATVYVTAPAGDDTISLPTTALVTAPSGEIGTMIFSPTGANEGHVTWTAIKVEATQHGDFRVLSGLIGGEEIVLTGGGALTDGQAVRRFSGFSN